MALEGWDKTKCVRIDPGDGLIPSGIGEITLPLLLSEASGLTSYDMTAMFDDLSTIDPYWDNVVLALPMDGNEGGTSFSDISNSGHAITRYGNTYTTAAQSVFDQSAFLDGSGDYLSIADSADFAFGSNNFCIELWMRSTGWGGKLYPTLIAQRASYSSGHAFTLGLNQAGTILSFAVSSNGTSPYVIAVSQSFAVNTWFHVAVVRNVNVISLYINGTLGASGSFSSSVYNSSAPLKIGAFDTTTYAESYFKGYIDDVCITNGSARYTGNFTPPVRSIAETSPYYTGVPPLIKRISLDLNDTGVEAPLSVVGSEWDFSNKTAIIYAALSSISQDDFFVLYWDRDHADNDANVTVLETDPAAPASGDELTLWNLAAADSLFSYSSIVFFLSVASSLEQLWSLGGFLSTDLVQAWGLKLGADLDQRWSDAPVIKGLLSQPWGNAGLIKSLLVQRWRDMVTLRAKLDQPWAVMESLLVALDQPWAITSSPVQALLDQGWDLKDITPVLAVLKQPWAIASDGTVLRYTVEVLADGNPVRVSHVNIEGGLDTDVLICEIHPETEAEYLLCPFGAELTVAINSQEGTDSFLFIVTSPSINEEHGSISYVVEAMSPAAMLGAPYADGIDGELSGLATEIAASLIGDLSLSWETVDWPIPAAIWIASGETPLALLKTLASAVGAVVQSDPDGTIAIRPRYPVAVPHWSTGTTDITLTETLDCFTSGATPDHRYGYNRFLVSNQSASADGLTLEEEAISATLKEVRGYQVPWDGLFDLTHTGGSWVVIEPLGIETREETETVEFVSGSGSTRYPIYGLVSVEWQQTNLGTITTAEDGSLTSSVDGQSLAEITYTTKCKRWRVADPRGEQLQLVAEI